jgi:WD40 repeat protein
MYKTLTGHVGFVHACDWSPVSKLLCSVGANRSAFIWSTDNYEIVHRLKGSARTLILYNIFFVLSDYYFFSNFKIF